MSLASERTVSYSGLYHAKMQEILVLLYKLLKPQRISLSPNDYQYNYEYIPPLAMTGTANVLDLNLPIPYQEFPHPQWVLLVLNRITIILINDALNKLTRILGNFAVFDVNNEHGHISPIQQQLQKLIDIEKSIQSSDNLSELESIALGFVDKVRNLKVLIHLPELQLPQLSVTSIEGKLTEIDEEFNTYYANENSQRLSFDQSLEAEDTTEKISSILRDIITINASILDFIHADLPQKSELTAPIEQPKLEDYNQLFKAISLPQISSRFQEDLVFAYMQVAGANPLMLSPVLTSKQLFAITNEEYAQIIGSADSLEAAIAEGRLYLADYGKLKSLENGSFPHQQKYIYAPRALFAVPPLNRDYRPLIPIAIQCQQPDVINNPIVTPLSGDHWQVAKTIVQMADSNYHELVSHLGRTHLFIEPFAIATRRRLPPQHPVRILLEPHLEGTILINYGAHKLLIANQGSVDELLASTIESDRQLAVQAAQDYLHHFDDAAFPNMLSSRGVDNYQLPCYPYRDDGRLIWDAIYQWVTAYLSIHYRDNYPLIADADLQNWAKELVGEDGGRLQNFGDYESGSINTLDYLINAVSTIIFTASAQHAAVNFPQAELMTYTPALPLAVYKPAPTSLEQPDSFLNFLPPLEQAQDQLKVTYLLGSIYYTQLGQYSKSAFVSNPHISSALKDFQNQLQEIEQEINWRNQTDAARIMPYKFLLPSQITQSINI